MRHEELSLKEGDLLIHAGDVLNYSRNHNRTLGEYYDFLEWFFAQPFKHKILVPGNHDLLLESEFAEEIRADITKAGVHFLNDRGVELEGLHFYGSPYTDLNMAFSAQGAKLQEKFAKIPADLDVLITHAAPKHILDGKDLGSRELLDRIKEVRPRVHIFGHIHEGYGMKKAKCKGEDVIFINCSSYDRNKEQLNAPINFNLAVRD